MITMVGIRSISLALLTLAMIPASAAATPTTQIIVKREPGVSGSERADIRANADVRFVDNLHLPQTEVVAAEPGDVRDAIRDLNTDPNVVYAERDRPVTAFAAQPDQCGPYGATPCLWGVARIFGDAPDAAWALSTGAGRTVAVVDSGVDAAHPDLSDKVAAGYDWVEDDADPQDESGHGTHVAGTIAAVRENGKGVVGVAPDARVVPLRVLDGNGTGSTSDGIEAFNWAGVKGIRVVNASLGGLGFIRSEYETFAKYPDTLFVVAAGNEGQDNDDPSTAQYPCAYGIAHPSAPALDNILCVGASDANEARADFSNYGAMSVDLYAPGVDIASTMLGQYWRSAGTSMATPHVAAAAALLAARNPTLTTIELKQAILDEAEPVAAGRRLNAAAALRAVPADADGDLALDADDNCPSVYNPGQEDTDLDSTGDDCEDGADDVDRDADSVPDLADACPDEPWPGGEGCALAAVTAPDTDHDGVPNARDLCPTVAVSGGFGCRDDDDDRVPNDGRDNCPSVANTNQTDADADGAGDACDGSPRGPDADGDGKPALDDTCPTVHGTLANGCPAPPPPPPPPDRDGDERPDASDACPDEAAATPNGCPIAQIATVSPRVKKRSATVTVTTSRAATVKILVQRKTGRGWVRVVSKRLATVGNKASLTVKRLKRGAHRVKVSISSSGGEGTARTKSFRVR